METSKKGVTHERSDSETREILEGQSRRKEKIEDNDEPLFPPEILDKHKKQDDIVKKRKSGRRTK